MTTEDAIPEEFELEGPDNGGWHHTQVRDWIPLKPDLSHVEFRVYFVMRSLLMEKRAPVRRLSIEEIRRLVPGIKGKEMSRTAIEDVLRGLKRHGLIEALDSGRSGGPVRWRIQDKPADPAAYPGWRNAFDKLDALRGKEPQHSGEVPGNPGRSGGGTRKSGQGTRKSGQGTRKSGRTTPSDQQKQDPQEPPQEVVQEVLPTPQGGGGISPARNNSDQEPEQFFATVPVPPAAWKTLRTDMITSLYEAYWSARNQGHSQAFLRSWLSDDLPARIQSLAGLWLRRLGSLPDPSQEPQQQRSASPEAGKDYPDEPCGSCDGRAGDPWNMRVVRADNGGSDKPCPRCHPHGLTNHAHLRAVS